LCSGCLLICVCCVLLRSLICVGFGEHRWICPREQASRWRSQFSHKVGVVETQRKCCWAIVSTNWIDVNCSIWCMG
jgi:hypothetical protein